MTRSQPKSFKFVIQDPTERFNTETQRLIRRHAATRCELSCTSELLFRNSSPEAANSSSPESPESVIPQPALQPQDRDRGLDPTNLSALTCLHVGEVASQILSSEPSRLSDLLLCRQSSYLSSIPLRLGTTSALDDAFRCLTSMADLILNTNSKLSNEYVLSCYSKALRSLQSAMNDLAVRDTSEVLSATCILALFELLNPTDGRAWSQHIAGASYLIQLRGQSQFAADFDKSLLISLAYPICTEAFLNDSRCFLEQSAWADVLLSTIIPDEVFTDRSALGIYLTVIKVKIPGLAHRVSHAVAVQDTLQPEDFEIIAMDLYSIRSNLLTWRLKFNIALMNAAQQCGNLANSFDKRFELLGLSLLINILVDRLLCSIVPNTRLLLEEEVQNHAREFKALQESQECNQCVDLFLREKAEIANAAIATHTEFQQLLRSEKIIDSWRLQKFFKAIGRTQRDSSIRDMS